MPEIRNPSLRTQKPTQEQMDERFRLASLSLKRDLMNAWWSGLWLAKFEKCMSTIMVKWLSLGDNQGNLTNTLSNMILPPFNEPMNSPKCYNLAV